MPTRSGLVRLVCLNDAPAARAGNDEGHRMLLMIDN